jgi:YegS/Rv2252/BmrU family lipid kinase
MQPQRTTSGSEVRQAPVVFLFNSGARLTGLGAVTPETLEAAMRERGVEARVLELGDGEEASQVAERAAREGAGVVVSVGGDGTVHSVATGLLRAGATAALGILPAGTMNNVAASLGIPEDLNAALDQLAACVRSGETRPLDLGMIGDLPFVEAAGFGIISDLMCIGETVKQNPLAAPAALPQVAQLLGRYRPAPVSVTVDGVEHRSRALHVLICNSPSLAMRIEAAPGARMDDALLDVVVYRRFRPFELLAYMVRRMGGRRIPDARVRRYRGREIVVQPSAAWPIEIDGDLVGHCGENRWRRIEARVLPGALRLAAPPEPPRIEESPLKTMLRALPAVPESVPAAVSQAATSAQEAVQQVVVPPRHAARRAAIIRGLYIGGGLLALGASIAARYAHILPGDVRITRSLQSTRSPLMDRFWTGVAWAGFPRESTALVTGSIVALWLARFRLEAAFLLLASGVNAVNFVLKRVVKRQRPTEPHVRVVRLIREPSFPSGHVMHYVSTLGFLSAAALANLRPSALRRVIVGGCAALIALVGPSRVYLGAHWPSDVAAGYIFGGLYLGGVLELYSLAKRREATEEPRMMAGISANEAAVRAGARKEERSAAGG